MAHTYANSQHQEGKTMKTHLPRVEGFNAAVPITWNESRGTALLLYTASVTFLLLAVAIMAYIVVTDA